MFNIIVLCGDLVVSFDSLESNYFECVTYMRESKTTKRTGDVKINPNFEYDKKEEQPLVL